MSRWTIACCAFSLILSPHVLASTSASGTKWQSVISSNPNVQIREEKVGIQKALKGQALSKLLPQIDVEANRGLEQTETDSSDLRLHPNLNSLVATQLLFDGLSNWNLYRAQHASYLEAKLGYQQALNALTGRWLSALIEIKKAQGIVQIEKKNYEYLEDRLSKAKHAVEADHSDRSSLFQAEGEHAEAKFDLARAKRQKTQALYELENITGHKRNTLNYPISIERLRKTLPKTEKAYIDQYLAYSLPLRQNQERIHQAKRELNSAKGDFFPVIDVTGTVERDHDQQGTAGKRFANSIMLNTRFNVLSGGRDWTTFHMRKHQLKETQKERENLLRSERMRAQNIWLNYRFYQQNLAALHKYRDNYRKTVEDYTELFNIGKKDIMQLFIINRQSMHANRQYLENYYESQKSIVAAAIAIQDVQTLFPKE